MKYEWLEARFSRCRNYRYSLSRRWAEGHGRVLFIGLNPSRADHRRDDPTVRRCVGFASDWGYREMELVNLFAYRSPQPAQLKRAADPVGSNNDRWIRRASARADRVVACWGTHGEFGDRASQVLRELSDLYCLRVTKNLQPAHPLYLPAGLTPQPLASLLQCPASPKDRP